jgi:hypothetical protein
MERNVIQLTRCDNRVLIMTPVQGKPFTYQAHFEDTGEQYNPNAMKSIKKSSETFA